LRPKVVQTRVVLQSVLYSFIQIGDGKYLGQDAWFLND
jgi:hypothetical protein